MSANIAKIAKTYTPTLDAGVLRFRHPWVLDDDKKGKWIRIGVARLSPIAQGELLEDAQKLLKKSPFLKSDAPSVDLTVSVPYFRAITRAKPPEYDLDYTNPFKPVIARAIVDACADKTVLAEWRSSANDNGDNPSLLHFIQVPMKSRRQREWKNVLVARMDSPCVLKANHEAHVS